MGSLEPFLWLLQFYCLTQDSLLSYPKVYYFCMTFIFHKLLSWYTQIFTLWVLILYTRRKTSCHIGFWGNKIFKKRIWKHFVSTLLTEIFFFFLAYGVFRHRGWDWAWGLCSTSPSASVTVKMIAEQQNTVIFSLILSLRSCDSEGSLVSLEGARKSGRNTWMPITGFTY